MVEVIMEEERNENESNTEKMDVDENDNNGDDDDEASIDEEQLQEYREMIDQLGSFPNKVLINSLSMVAEDHADSTLSAQKIYDCIRTKLQSVATPRDRKLPLVYVIDSILKNVKGSFIKIIEEDAKIWMPAVYHSLPDDSQREKLKRVWITWNQYQVFDDVQSWKEMGLNCGFTEEDISKFSSTNTTTSSGNNVGNSTSATGGATTASGSGSGKPSSDDTNGNNQKNNSDAGSNNNKIIGVTRAKDGSLQLTSALRKEMQNILDELQSDIQNELDKVSLERLAEINPDLLNNIITTAKTNLNQFTNNSNNINNNGVGSSNRNDGHNNNHHHNHNNNNDEDMMMNYIPPYFTEIRSDATLQRSKVWNKLELDHMKQSHELISKLQQSIRKCCSSYSDEQYQFTQSEAIEMTHTLACASAIATVLTNELQVLQQQEESRNNHRNTINNANSVFGGNHSNSMMIMMGGNTIIGGSISSALAIDKKQFTNDGVKKKNDTVIGILYEVGLPFVSSSDGRRFGTQLELSNHLDALFKRSQLEKSMARTEERGWYFDDQIWTGEFNNKNEKSIFDKSRSGGAGGAGAGAGAGGGGVGVSGGTNDSSDNNIGGVGGSMSDYFYDDDTADPLSFTVPADESRDRCAICGINFRMFFDNDDGVYKYNNCREITVFHDDAAAVESEELLIKVTCWRGLGKPQYLTADQTLQAD